MDKNIYSKLNKIQQELKAPKDKTGSGIRYKYRSCEDILEAVKPLLDGLCIFIEDEIILVGDRYYVKATATISDGKELIKTSALAREPQSMASINESQVTGATSSYARKYALNGLLAIDDTKDADALSADGLINVSVSVPNTSKTVSNPTNEVTYCTKHGIQMIKFTDVNGLHYYAHVGTQGTKCYGK